jgi:hypothetical protein
MKQSMKKLVIKMTLNNDAKDDLVYEDACVNSVCDSMSPVDMLLSLTQECPLDCKSASCPIKKIQKWRKMGLKQAYNHITLLPLSEQKKLVEEHRRCSSVNPDKR